MALPLVLQAGKKAQLQSGDDLLVEKIKARTASGLQFLNSSGTTILDAKDSGDVEIYGNLVSSTGMSLSEAKSIADRSESLAKRAESQGILDNSIADRAISLARVNNGVTDASEAKSIALRADSLSTRSESLAELDSSIADIALSYAGIVDSETELSISLARLALSLARVV